MDSEALRRFIVIAECGSLSKAAARLGITQPALTRTLQALEAHYGEELVRRTPAGVVLTSFGQAALMRAKLINAELRNLESEINALRSLSTGQVNVGIPSGIGFTSEVLPAATLAIATDQSRLEISYAIGTHEHLLASLRRGDLDFLIADVALHGDGSDLVQEVILEDHLGLFVRAEHPLAKEKRLSSSALANHSWMVLSDSIALEHAIRAALAKRGVPFTHNLMRSNSALFVRAMLAKSNAVGFMSLDATRPNVEREELVELRLVDGELPPAPIRELGLIYRRGCVLSTAAQALAQRIRLLATGSSTRRRGARRGSIGGPPGDGHPA